MTVKRETDVLVVGAGPVGLLSALSLVERGLDVQVIDKDWRGATHSYALAVHPGALRLLDDYGAAGDLLEHGYKIERIAIYHGKERVGELDFAALGGPFPFILVAPQSALERALEKRLNELKVKVLWNHQAMTVNQASTEVTSKIARMEKYSTGYPVAHTEWMVAKEYTTRSAFVVGADGYHSFVRKTLDVAFEHVGAAECFSVYEFTAPLGFRNEARIVFDGDTTNVLWPLGDDRGRWSFQVPQEEPAPPTLDALQDLVAKRAPWFEPKISEVLWNTTALFERRLVDGFGRDRVWLVGDASHITGPVGGQSMNIGLLEAHDLAERFSSIHKGGGSFDLLNEYAKTRRDEWSTLLGLTGGPESSGATAEWARNLAMRLVPCLPTSGEGLGKILEQIGLALK